jgi:hypothetical protein
MKAKNLFPHRWKPFGWILLVLFLPLGIWLVVDDSQFPLSVIVTFRWPFADAASGTAMDLINYTNGLVTLELIDELIALGVLAGLIIAGFARLKNEDERTAHMRLEALQWALYGNTLILAFCIAVIHGSLFLNVMIYTMFTPLLIFVLRFHWLLWQETRALRGQKGGEVLI